MTATTLDRTGVSQAIAELLQADTTTLYGTGLLLQKISYDVGEFTEAKTEQSVPYALYIWASDVEPLEGRMRNVDDLYSVDLIYVAGSTNVGSTSTAIAALDDAHERVSYLVRNQMWSGGYLTTYESDSNRRIVDIEMASSTLPAPEKRDDGTLVFELVAAITVRVNRLA